MKGLCHSCLTSDVELVDDMGQILCFECFGRKHQKKSPENESKPSLDDLKKKWESKNAK